MKTILKKASAAVMALAVMGAAVAFDVPGKMTAKAASADGVCESDHTTAWDNTTEFMINGDYYLDHSVEINAEIDITGDVTLCLNGKTITAVSDTRIFNVKNGGTLTICDCNGRGEIIGGAVSNNGGDNNGGAVYVDKGGTFTLSGGTIRGNSAIRGGGVYVNDNGKFTMSGGKILGNTAGQEGGGVYVNSKGEFEMTGGEISGNTVEYIVDNNNGGGGVYTAGTFTMSGKSKISGNTVGNIATGEYHFGGGVCVSGSSAKFEMKDGEISGNKAGYGGGVYVAGGTFEMTGGKIDTNTETRLYGWASGDYQTLR
ncbi:MAG: hypothetical protein K2N38_00925, partial [Oscillospiraceae bacterium]|nr:hypothetical protein [Oscillospiraceae bacterium]